jgi:glycosyltransferase involved in cell wall biosynthesis
MRVLGYQEGKMERLILFDTEGEKGHNWFYNYNILLALEDSKFDIEYITSISNKDKIKMIKRVGVNFTNACVQPKENIYGVSFKENKILRAIKNNIKEKLIFRNSTIKLVHSELCTLRDVLTKKGKIEQVSDVIKNFEKDKIASIHFLTLDYIIYELFFLCIKNIFSIHKKNKIKITATLHWAPNFFLKWFVIKWLLKYGHISKLIVHGDYIKEAIINKLGGQFENYICTIPYPVSPSQVRDRDSCINKIGLNKHTGPFLLCFGVTRYDKGVDLVLDACKLIKEPFILIVAGEEGEITEKFINKKIKDLSLQEKVFINIKYIKDELLPYYFSISDIIILPYRKIFTGQSGPLTEGINYNKIIIGPNINEIGYTIAKYNVGKLFKCEDIGDLASKIEDCIKNLEELKKKLIIGQELFKKETNIEQFKSNYKEFFYAL